MHLDRSRSEKERNHWHWWKSSPPNVIRVRAGFSVRVMVRFRFTVRFMVRVSEYYV